MADIATMKISVDTTELDAAIAKAQELTILLRGLPPREQTPDNYAEARSFIAQSIRNHCTPSTEAYARGGDFLVRAVADWVENPPEWVAKP